MESAHIRKSLEPLQVYMGKGRLWMLGAGCLIFVALGLWFISLYRKQEESFMFALIGLVSVLFFGACLLFYIKRLFDRSPAVVLDEQGILDNSSYIGGGSIPWEEIEDIELYQLAGQNMIGIQLKNPEAYLEQRKGFKRWLMKVNQGMVQAPVNIAQSALRIPLRQLYEEMNMRLELHRQSRLG